MESSKPQSTMVSSVGVMENDRTVKASGRRPWRIKQSQVLGASERSAPRGSGLHTGVDGGLGLKSLSHEDLCNHYCVGWLKTHEAHFSRDKTLETADLTGTPKKSIFGPVIYPLLKEFGSSGLILEPPMHRTSLVRSRVAIPAQLRAVERILEPKSMGLPDTAYMGSKLLEGPRYGKSYGTSQLA